jgi:hypothetical protein
MKLDPSEDPGESEVWGSDEDFEVKRNLRMGKRGATSVSVIAFEKNFIYYWEVIIRLWNDPQRCGCLALGCGRDTFAIWANKEFWRKKYPEFRYSAGHWRRVLNRGVDLGLAVEGRSKLNYRTFTPVGHFELEAAESEDEIVAIPEREHTLFHNDAVTRRGNISNLNNPLAGTRFA